MAKKKSKVKASHSLDIHRCRFVDYNPSAITALAFSQPSNPQLPTPTSLRLAVGRANGDIEIWTPHNDWGHEITLKGGRFRSVEGLAWIPSPFGLTHLPRLFSIGSSSYLTEWDIQSSLPKQSIDSNAGSIWSLASSPKNDFLALGCEDGSVVIIDVRDGDMSYSRILERQTARVLSLTFHPDGSKIIGGCDDSSIRVWEFSHPHGRIAQRMQVDQNERKLSRGRKKKEQTLIWAVMVLSDGTMVSGDSTGSLKIWDGNVWGMVSSFKAHAADILCLTASHSGSTIFSAGIDRKLVSYRLVQSNKLSRWTIVNGRRFHAHDVRCMTSFESLDMDFVISGSVDMSLAVVPLTTFMSAGPHHRIIAPVPQERKVQVATEGRLILCWEDAEVKLWRIGKMKSEADSQQPGLERKYLLKIKFNAEENISTAAISPDGRYLLIATPAFSKLFALKHSPVSSIASETIGVEKVRKFSHGSRFAVFSPNSKSLILVSPLNEIRVHSVSPTQTAKKTWEIPKEKGFITKFAVSGDGKKVGIATSTSYLAVYHIDSETSMARLPQPSSHITSISFLTSNMLSVTLARANQLLLFTEKLGEWTLRNVSLSNEGESLVDKCLGTFLVGGMDEKIWMWGVNWLGWVSTKEILKLEQDEDGVEELQQKNSKRSHDDEIEDESKKRRKMHSSSGNGGHQSASSVETNFDRQQQYLQRGVDFWYTYKYRSLLLVDILRSVGKKAKGRSEVIVVERPLFDMLKDVQEGRFWRQEYGES